MNRSCNSSVADRLMHQYIDDLARAFTEVNNDE